MNTDQHFTYHIVPRNESAGGGWMLRLMENDIEVGGGTFPVTVDMTSAAAHLEATNAGEAWLWSHMQSAVDVDHVAASLCSAHQGDEVAMAAAMLIDQSFEIDQLRTAAAAPALQALVAQLRRTLCSIQGSPRLADVRSLASLGLARIDAPATGQQSGDHWTSPGILPDADTVVLLALTDDDVWPGYRDADSWRASEGFVIDDARVVAWMHMPVGPTLSQVQTSARLQRASSAPADRTPAANAGSREPIPLGVSNYLDADGRQRSSYSAPAASQAAHDVLAERRRQVEHEGYDNKNDDHYSGNELVMAAVCYAVQGDSRATVPLLAWPWSADGWKPRGARLNLVRACALLLAEIDRLDRAVLPGSQSAPEKANGNSVIFHENSLPAE